MAEPYSVSSGQFFDNDKRLGVGFFPVGSQLPEKNISRHITDAVEVQQSLLKVSFIFGQIVELGEASFVLGYELVAIGQDLGGLLILKLFITALTPLRLFAVGIFK